MNIEISVMNDRTPRVVEIHVSSIARENKDLMIFDKQKAIKDVIEIIPIKTYTSMIGGSRQECLSINNVTLENNTGEYYYSDNSLGSNDKIDEEEKGVDIIIEDVKCDLKDIIVRSINGDYLEEMTSIVRLNGDKIFDTELMHGVFFIIEIGNITNNFTTERKNQLHIKNREKNLYKRVYRTYKRCYRAYSRI